jgi:hypothetical protein
MTRKDFIFIADVIRSMSPLTRDREAIATDFANRLGETNPRFNRALFVQAATGVVALTARKAVA